MKKKRPEGSRVIPEKWILALMLVFLPVSGCRNLAGPSSCPCKASYEEEIRAWHEQRIAELKQEKGWLMLAGLFWLEEGEKRFGSDPDGDIVFPESAPALIGTLTHENGETRLKIAPGVEAFCGQEPVDEMVMKSDAEILVEPDYVEVGQFTFLIIKRGDRFGLRLFDKEAEALQNFTGIETFPVDKKWRIEARFEPYDEPKTVLVPTVIQTKEEAEVPGEVTFTVEGEHYSLTPMSLEESDELFFVFGDATNGKETYGGGRFLIAEPPEKGKVVLDFNKAYNPPCAFTKYATCPVSRPENRLPIAITAGEKKYVK